VQFADWAAMDLLAVLTSRDEQIGSDGLEDDQPDFAAERQRITR